MAIIGTETNQSGGGQNGSPLTSLSDKQRAQFSSLVQETGIDPKLAFIAVTSGADLDSFRVNFNKLLSTVDPSTRNGLLGQVGNLEKLVSAGVFYHPAEKPSGQQIDEEVLARTGELESNRLNRDLSTAYDDAERTGIEAIDRDSARQRTQAIEEEASRGRLGSPVSRARGSAIPLVDENRTNAVQNFVSGLRGDRAKESVGVSKFLQDLFQKNRESLRGQSAISNQLQFNREGRVSDINQLREGNALKERLAFLDANTRKDLATPSDLDKIEQGFNISGKGMEVLNPLAEKSGGGKSGVNNMLKMAFLG